MAELILFYDGACPLCVREIGHLTRLDEQGRIQCEDIQKDDFEMRWPQVDPQEASSILLGYYHGQVIKGLDVTHRAWSLVGRGWLTAPLRWPVVRPVADRVYLWFARHRYTISGVLTGRRRCDSCTSGKCDIPRR
ncbi:thiol-disulfide oxidoreductase DCC family protein [Larsenimonas rhizosphaerae]|uniref:DUF393 domain-containing protein n=1 Tax=Larsenimonas rhizosphaerae TaxID=2944682 RepID=A0AA42CU39_9GAMM|nr:DUF393 domain-containing protein [Larsenimonas rhizosphaerae]MCX2524257.1 DUF393 domain-containing protein [Larsenimonas rhizosphaerae]